MEISYLGHSCFKVVGKKITVLCDPYKSEKVGLKLSKQDADVVTVSHQHDDHNFVAAVKSENYLLLDSPGEFEVKESEFVGIQSEHGCEIGMNTIFSFEVEGVKICHLGDLGLELKSDQLGKIDADILMVPVGGKCSLDPKLAVKVIGQIQPKIVLPMHFKAGSMTELGTLEEFLHEMSVEPTVQDKLKIVKKDLPEKLEVITLKY